MLNKILFIVFSFFIFTNSVFAEIWTISDVSNCSIIQNDSSSGNLIANSSTYTFDIYSYDTFPENFNAVYSFNPCSVNLTDNGSLENYFLNISWDRVSTATGYKIRVYDSSNFYEGDYYYLFDGFECGETICSLNYIPSNSAYQSFTDFFSDPLYSNNINFQSPFNDCILNNSCSSTSTPTISNDSSYSTALLFIISTILLLDLLRRIFSKQK